MTTRAQLESEREALVELRSQLLAQSTWHAALTASIARVEALLSLSDDECLALAGTFDAAAEQFGGMARVCEVYRTVADIVRRS